MKENNHLAALISVASITSRAIIAAVNISQGCATPGDYLILGLCLAKLAKHIRRRKE